MRRSKSNPAKAIRNYRSISQRRMTNEKNEDREDQAEMNRLRQVLASHDHVVLASATACPAAADCKKSKTTTTVSSAKNTEKKVIPKQQDDDHDDHAEMQRLRRLLASHDHIAAAAAAMSKKAETTAAATTTTAKAADRQHKKEEQNKKAAAAAGDDDEILSTKDDTLESSTIDDKDEEIDNNHYVNGEIPLVYLSKKKKTKDCNTVTKVELTAEEIRQAKITHKNVQRKLQTLQQRAAQNKKRQDLYQTLQATALNDKQRRLLQSSAHLGKRTTKRQELQRILYKEQSGILPLTESERDLLYQRNDDNSSLLREAFDNNNNNNNDHDDDSNSDVDDNVNNVDPVKSTSSTTRMEQESFSSAGIRQQQQQQQHEQEKESSPLVVLENNKAKKKRKRKVNEEKDDVVMNVPDDASDDDFVQPVKTKATLAKENDDDSKSCAAGSLKQKALDSNHDAMEEEEEEIEGKEESQPSPSKKSKVLSSIQEEQKPSSFSFATQMMASLSQLKTDSEMRAKEKQAADAEEAAEAERQRLAQEEAERKKKKAYVPTNPTIVKTAAKLGLVASQLHASSTATNMPLLQINRPHDVQTARMTLPIAEMEFEVMDAIRNHDVTIICGECGSGKSTQIPQFLYEAGMTTRMPSENGSSADAQQQQHYMVGVTQPRRVAAVSTAKRVCFEMGQGNGQVIPNSNKDGKSKGGKSGNLVAYQTRYETAGLDANATTHIKFMTDGILLQEIQSDLLLRKYSVIVLDEAHERNLNTDVLIGLLLSATLPLRRQAALEEGNSTLVPLKLVIMSATLRVQDFTANNKLFAAIATSPAVVRIPGRTFPVTIHHAKVTEMEKYQDVALKKICKIHRRLPPGGILVFLTGKQEILVMVRKLRRILDKKNRRNGHESNEAALPMTADVHPVNDVHDDGDGLRDLDDDEIDGDIFRDENDDDDDDDLDHVDALITETKRGKEDDKGVLDSDGPAIPDKVLVLPLYSLMAPEEQAKVFAPVPEGHRLIVVATNIAETSITIPGISYVVDSGRQKCRNYNAGTGVASFDIMWVSKAAADQRAGRAGRTGPGHCYRLYSSSMYSRHMDGFALPEVLNRPLEDVVLAMKAMKISNVADFAFPTPPSTDQLDAAVKLLANVGCVDKSDKDEMESDRNDGVITRLGAAVSRLPLGVRYGKMLLVAAEAGVLDYAIVMVAALSESNPFIHHGQHHSNEETSDVEEDLDEKESASNDKEKRKQHRWNHRGGDVMAVLLAVGAYTYAGRYGGDRAARKFCEENGLNPVVMSRIQKMRIHLARLAKARLSNADGVAAKTGGILTSMKPPNKVQERLLSQAIASGLLDNVAMLAPLGSIPSEHGFSMRTAYIGCSTKNTEPLFMDSNSVLYSRDSRLLPKWICFDYLMRKQLKNGTPIAIMKNVTPIDPSWLGILAKGSRLLSLGEPLASPPPMYDTDKDAVVCSVLTKFGNHAWQIPCIRTDMYDALQAMKRSGTTSQHFFVDDSFRWFVRFLLEGKILPELAPLESMLNDSPAKITRQTPVSKVALLVSACASAGVDTAAALRKHWATVDDKFLFLNLKTWILSERRADAKKLWIETVKQNVRLWRQQQS